MAALAIQAAKTIWGQAERVINEGRATKISLPVLTQLRIGKVGIDIIKAKYSELIQAEVITRVTAAGLLQFMPPNNTWGPVFNPAEKVVDSKKSKLPRPPNAFILYRQQHHPSIKEAYPDLHNNQISIILGKQWKNEDKATKDMFKRMAEDLKKKHFEENPGYHYQPRKPTEKKRRMTRRKLDTICKSASTHVESSTELASVETFQADGNSTALPDIETIEAGNAAVTYGDETIDDESFEAMLKHYNSTIPDSGPHHGKSTAIYTERTAEANENITLYGAKCFDDIFLGPTQQESLAELDRILGPIEKLDEAWDTLDGSQQAQILSPDFDFDSFFEKLTF